MPRHDAPGLASAVYIYVYTHYMCVREDRETPRLHDC